jgi:hypothetical protein
MHTKIYGEVHGIRKLYIYYVNTKISSELQFWNYGYYINGYAPDPRKARPYSIGEKYIIF